MLKDMTEKFLTKLRLCDHVVVEIAIFDIAIGVREENRVSYYALVLETDPEISNSADTAIVTGTG